MISSSLALALVAALAQVPAKAPPPVPNPFQQLLPNLGRDIKSLASESTALVMGVGGAAALASHNSDVPIRDWVLKQPDAPAIAHIGNFAGDAFVQGGLAVATWLTGRNKGHVRLEATGADLIRAQILNGALTVPIKYTVNRERPDKGTHSFPSGHTSATFATAAVISRDYGVAASLPFYALGGLVSWSRIRTNHHWLSDDVFGAAIGITSGLAVTKGHTGKWSVVPVKTAGGGAIYVIRR